MVKLKIVNEKGQVFMSDVDHSPFGRAMRTLLATELNHRDLVLTAEESSPYKLVFEVQKVFHKFSPFKTKRMVMPCWLLQC